MKLSMTLRTAIALLLALPALANASLIFESSALANRQPNCCGYTSIFSGDFSSSGNPQWLGVRFSLNDQTHVTGIGGLVGVSQGSLFAAVVRLSGPAALPSGSPFDTSDLQFLSPLTGVPSGDNYTVDYTFQTDFELDAGSYGLIFGAGAPEASGFGGMHIDPAKDLVGSDNYFFYGNQGFFPGGPIWRNLELGGLRFTLQGEAVSPVPEPATHILAFLALAALVAGRNQRTFQRQTL